MSNSTRFAILLALAIAPASTAFAATKHAVSHQVGPAVEQQAPGSAAYGYSSQTPPSVTEPTYMWIQDQSIGTGQ
jgi:hypothetical protein